MEQCLPPLFTIHNGLISQSEVLGIKEQILVLFEWVYTVFKESCTDLSQLMEPYQFTLVEN